MNNVEQARRWLTWLYGERPDGLIWIGPSDTDWTGRCFATPAEAAAYAVQLDAGGATPGVYHRLTTVQREPEWHKRGDAELSASLPALAMDLDIKGPGHKRDNLPDSEADLARILAAAGLPEPSAWVHSGGGRYAYWLIRPAPATVNPQVLDRVKELSAEWHGHVIKWAKSLGLHVDNTRDLARVYRLPGTTNRKAGQPRPCYVISASGAGYDLDGLESALIHAPSPPAPPPAVRPAGSAVGTADSAMARVEQFVIEAANLPEGEGNTGLARIGFMVGQYVGAGQVDMAWAEQRLCSALDSWEFRGSPRDHQERTIRSALEHGAENPRQWEGRPGVMQVPPPLVRPSGRDLNDPPPSVVHPPALNPNTGPRWMPPPGRPLDAVDVLLAEGDIASHDGVPMVCRWQRVYHVWESGVWLPVDDEVIEKFLYEAMRNAQYPDPDRDDESRMWSPSIAKIKELNTALGKVRVARVASEPTAEADRSVIVLKNGILNLRTMEMSPHSPSLFNLTMLPFPFDRNAECPCWMRFLESAFPRDPESVQLLAECFGEIVFGDTKRQKAPVLAGESGAGKGTVIKVLESLIGENGCVAANLQDLSGTFGREELIGKRLAVLGDVRWNVRGARDGIARLLEIVGRDTQTISRKNRRAWTGTLGLHVAIASNDPPDFTDPSGALARRLNLIHFRESFVGKEDPGLLDKLLEELPGILNWSLRGYRDLAAQGRFTVPTSASDLAEEVRDRASHVRPFARDALEFRPDGETWGGKSDDDPYWISSDLLFRAWSAWRRDENVSWDPSKSEVSAEFRKLFQRAGVEKAHRGASRRRGFLGARISAGFQSRFPAAIEGG